MHIDILSCPIATRVARIVAIPLTALVLLAISHYASRGAAVPDPARPDPRVEQRVDDGAVAPDRAPTSLDPALRNLDGVVHHG